MYEEPNNTKEIEDAVKEYNAIAKKSAIRKVIELIIEMIVVGVVILEVLIMLGLWTGF